MNPFAFPTPRVARLPWQGVAAGLSLLALTGCYTPQTRARERPAAFQELSPADRKLALDGQVREGFSKDAVYIAWGAPSRDIVGSRRAAPFEFWYYAHTNYGAGGGYFGVSRGFVYPGKDGHGRFFDTPDDFYEAPPYIRGLPPPSTEVPYRRVVFEQGHVINYAPH